MDEKAKVKEEINKEIYKYQKDDNDINQELGQVFGPEFVKYREDFNKTQRYLEVGFLPESPLHVTMEPINRCNLNCVMCFKKHHFSARNELSLGEMERVFQECKERKIPSFLFGLSSEILIYKYVKDMINMAGKVGFQDIWFGTNGVLLDDETIDLLFKNKITKFEVSLDAATNETYLQIRRDSPSLEKVEANIEKLIAKKKELKSPIPKVRVSFIVMEKNAHEISPFIEKWKDKADFIDFQRFINHDFVDKPADVDQKVIQETLKDSFCAYPFYSLNVWSDGRVTPCCTYFGKYLPLGNIRNQTLQEIWKGEAIQRIREQIITKKFNPICSKCLFYRDRELIKQHFPQ